MVCAWYIMCMMRTECVHCIVYRVCTLHSIQSVCMWCVCMYASQYGVCMYGVCVHYIMCMVVCGRM